MAFCKKPQKGSDECFLLWYYLTCHQFLFFLCLRLSSFGFYTVVEVINNQGFDYRVLTFLKCGRT